jgi:predicted transcriptional regulator
MMAAESLLENQTRRLVYDHILANPGVSFIVLKNVLNLNESTLRYHLNYLEKSEKISFGLEKGRRYYYPYSGERHVIRKSEDDRELTIYELTNTQERIVTIIKRYPKINQKELSKKTRINRITLGRNLKKLMELCLVRKITNGNKVMYEYLESEQLRYEILKRLLKKLLSKEIDEETFLELKKQLDER